MLKEFWDVAVMEHPLQPPPLRFSPESGGVVEFYGIVRGAESTEAIVAIRYEAFLAMAESQLHAVAVQAAEKFLLHGLILHHRIGVVPVAEPSLFLRTSAKHRAPAFDAATWIVERLKVAVPIWKHALNNNGQELPSPLPSCPSPPAHEPA